MTIEAPVKKNWFGFRFRNSEEPPDPFLFPFDDLRNESRIALDPVALRATNHIENLTNAVRGLEMSFGMDKLAQCIDLTNKSWREYFVTFGQHPAILNLGSQFAAVMKKIDDSIGVRAGGLGIHSRARKELDQKRSTIGFYRNALEVLTEKGVIAAEEAILSDPRGR